MMLQTILIASQDLSGFDHLGEGGHGNHSHEPNKVHSTVSSRAAGGNGDVGTSPNSVAGRIAAKYGHNDSSSQASNSPRIGAVGKWETQYV